MGLHFLICPRALGYLATPLVTSYSKFYIILNFLLSYFYYYNAPMQNIFSKKIKASKMRSTCSLQLITKITWPFSYLSDFNKYFYARSRLFLSPMHIVLHLNVKLTFKVKKLGCIKTFSFQIGFIIQPITVTKYWNSPLTGLGPK